MIAVGLAPMMEEQENLETRRVIRHRSEVGVCVIRKGRSPQICTVYQGVTF